MATAAAIVNQPPSDPRATPSRSGAIEWSMRNANGFHFRSNSSGQTTVAAVLGRERNEVFL